MRLNAETFPHFKAELTANAGGINLDSVVDSIGGALGDSGQRVTDVEEFHTRISHVLGHRPEIVHEETKAVVRPIGSDSPPEIEIVSNDVKRGIFSGGGGVKGLLGNPLEIFRTSHSRVDDDGLADLVGAEANSSSTTNVVNIFTFNIYVHNSTEEDEKSHPRHPDELGSQPLQQQQFSYATNLGHPFLTRLQSTSHVNSPAQRVLSSHHYKANVRNHEPVKKPPMFPMEMFPGGSESWLKQLMERQMNGGADTTALTRAALFSGRMGRLEDEPAAAAASISDLLESNKSPNANSRPEAALFREEGRSGQLMSADDFGSVFFRKFLPDTPVGPQIFAPKKQGSPAKDEVADDEVTDNKVTDAMMR